MASPQFLNYPEPREIIQAPEFQGQKEDKNPALRGRALSIAIFLISKFAFIQKYLWDNANFPDIRDVPGIDELPRRVHPHVVPLKNGSETPQPLKLAGSGQARQPADLVGRYNCVEDYHEAYKSGALTPLEVAETILSLITRGQSPRSKYDVAWVDAYGMEKRVLADAKASTERYAAGKELGVMDGVPIGVKDDVEVEGWVVHDGMKYNPRFSFFKPSTKTAPVIKKLQAAGAIVVGKNAMHELGGDTNGCNPHWGTPTNWHNTSYYPGGSSSGAASSLCAGIIPFSVGTDAGGSCRIPLSFTGGYGLKVSHNRCQVLPNTQCTVGPLASNVADLTIGYKIMAEPDPSDGVESVFGPYTPPASGKKTIGLCREWLKASDPRVLELCMKAVDYFKTKCGYDVVDIEIPYIRACQLAHGEVCCTEFAQKALQRVENRADWPKLLNPASKLLVFVGLQTPALDFIRCSQLRELLMRHLAFLFEEYPGLLIMTPTTPLHGWIRDPKDEHCGLSDANKSLESMKYAFLANFSGCPAVTAPIGYSEPEKGEGKIPIGLMATGQWGADEQLLAWAGEAETYLHQEYSGGRQRPSAWVDILQMAKDRKQSKNGSSFQ